MENKTFIIVVLSVIVAAICIPLWVKTTKPLFKYFRRKNSVTGRDRLNRSSLSIDVQKRGDAIAYMIIYYIVTFVIACLVADLLLDALGIIDTSQK